MEIKVRHSDRSGAESFRARDKNPGSRRAGSLPLFLLALAVLAYLLVRELLPGAVVRPDETWTRMETDRVMRIGLDPSFPPFEADDGQGHLFGMEIDLAQVFAARWAAVGEAPWRVEYAYTGFDGLYDALNARQFDFVLSALPYNPAKTEDVNFTHAYYDGGPVIVLAGAGESAAPLAPPPLTPTPGAVRRTLTLLDLQDKRVGVELGSTGDALVRKWTRRLRVTVRTYDTMDATLAAVGRGEVEAALSDPVSFYQFTRATKGASSVSVPLHLASEPLEHEYLVIAVRKDSPTLRDQLNAAIDDLKKNGVLEGLLQNAVGN